MTKTPSQKRSIIAMRKREIVTTKKYITIAYKSIMRELNKKYTDNGYLTEKLNQMRMRIDSILRDKKQIEYLGG